MKLKILLMMNAATISNVYGWNLFSWGSSNSQTEVATTGSNSTDDASVKSPVGSLSGLNASTHGNDTCECAGYHLDNDHKDGKKCGKGNEPWEWCYVKIANCPHHKAYYIDESKTTLYKDGQSLDHDKYSHYGYSFDICSANEEDLHPKNENKTYSVSRKVEYQYCGTSQTFKGLWSDAVECARQCHTKYVSFDEHHKITQYYGEGHNNTTQVGRCYCSDKMSGDHCGHQGRQHSTYDVYEVTTECNCTGGTAATDCHPNDIKEKCSTCHVDKGYRHDPVHGICEIADTPEGKLRLQEEAVELQTQALQLKLDIVQKIKDDSGDKTKLEKYLRELDALLLRIDELVLATAKFANNGRLLALEEAEILP